MSPTKRLVWALRDELGWVDSVEVTTPDLGHRHVTISPPPQSDVEELALAQTIYKWLDAADDTIGQKSRVIDGADGMPRTIRWDVRT